MTDPRPTERPTYNGLPLYRSGQAPKYMRTVRQLIEDFDMKPGGPVRAYVETWEHGPVALYQINEAEIINPPK